MDFLIITNPMKNGAMEFTLQIAEYLFKLGQRVKITPNSACGFLKDMPDIEIMDSESGDRPDSVIIIGGDGTVLRNVDLLKKLNAPVLGINFGHLGYLTACEPSEAKSSIDKIIIGSCGVEERILLDGEIKRENGESSFFGGLNEAVIYRGALSRALHFELDINGNNIASFSADGILIATPAGSTAYNLSAGGPILMPTADNLVITPICASAVPKSSIVVSGTDNICIHMYKPEFFDEESLDFPMLVVDGREKYAITDNERIYVKKSKDVLRLYNVQNDSFFRTLQKKMMRTI
ncbi:MAG: NAD(+)/NADH kinase [Lachnospiraceae bacterium]|nr:NAD(+)/NADH kinase [Lachnospiraceae bacterium]